MKDINIRKFISKLSFIALLLFLIHAQNIYAEQPVLYSLEKVNDSTYIDATEMNVGSWLSYYNWILIHEGYINAKKVLPDSTQIDTKVWNYIKEKTGDYISTDGRYTGQPIGYFKKMTNDRDVLDKGDGSSGFDIYNLPVVGISYEQVVHFCKWRTKVNGKGKYVFRLPTENEWIRYCKAHIDSYGSTIYMTDSVTNNGKCVTYNYYHKNRGNGEMISHVFPMSSFVCDKNYVFDMFGNVSEMVSEKGKAKGGNYTLYASQCNMDSVQFYTKPEKWLGFRCVAIKISEENDYELQKVSISDTLNNKYSVYVDERDGNIYPTAKIGNNIWFSKNLAYKPKAGKYWAYLNKEETIEEQGYLYTWEVATNICPEGWELPTKEDYQQLIDNYGDSAYVELRPRGSSGFCSYSTGMHYGINFTKGDDCAVYWSSSEQGKRTTWGLCVGDLKHKVTLYSTYSKGSGLPVRCVKRQKDK